MKIGHTDHKPAATPVSERKAGAADATTTTSATANTAAAAASATQAAAPAEASSQVELSSSAALSHDGSTPEFDSEKVSRIAQAIRDGKFTVNPEAIADKLISNAHEVLSRTSH